MTEPTPVFIRAVPWVAQRAANARRLKLMTGGRIVWDTTHSGYENFIYALRYARHGDAIHLEDDILLTGGWRGKVQAVIADHSAEMIQFYSRRGDDLTVGSRYQPGRGFLWAVCFYVPARLAEPLLAYVDGWDGRAADPTGLDVAVGAFLADRHERYWLSVPSLVQHCAWPSVIRPGRSTRRQSATFQRD